MVVSESIQAGLEGGLTPTKTLGEQPLKSLRRSRKELWVTRIRLDLASENTAKTRQRPVQATTMSLLFDCQVVNSLYSSRFYMSSEKPPEHRPALFGADQLADNNTCLQLYVQRGLGGFARNPTPFFATAMFYQTPAGTRKQRERTAWLLLKSSWTMVSNTSLVSWVRRRAPKEARTDRKRRRDGVVISGFCLVGLGKGREFHPEGEPNYEIRVMFCRRLQWFFRSKPTERTMKSREPHGTTYGASGFNNSYMGLPGLKGGPGDKLWPVVLGFAVARSRH